mmetsp:Transcript_471/g.554  ORF Transcript_471/g.554 Transcript_471/m.554 type:complete len:545 (-) Transcript_471:45-1679(-)|eukprot:CAMPEP_0194129906 /NCGR_PEP_ID=MMETSP0152-20130528/1098_1 /TAXON_ID=1049557 /ORGANISM="Thalassiothrix antarctica, Strain L6-D1" /LENGTH=544 /DNA_ID=CAMNT_0038824287 /DNA_START=59 /DNA_END=1693 /DNA_ORIENTATION=+
MTTNKTETRLEGKNFNDFDGAECRRRREETQINLRKAKKNERLAKRRFAPETTAGIDDDDDDFTSFADLPKFVQIVQNTEGSAEELMVGVLGIRKMLSVNLSPPVKEVVDTGIIKYLVAILMRVDAPVLQFEASWALTNIASSAYTSSVADVPNAIENFVKLLLSFDPKVREQSAWCLANIAGDCPAYRDQILKLGALSAMVMNMKEPATNQMLATVVWAVSNLCRGKPQPDLQLIQEVIQPLFEVILKYQQINDVQIDALWALSYISDGSDERIQSVLAGGNSFLEHLKKVLLDGKQKLIAPALRILGNFASGSENQTQAVVDAGILGAAPQVLDSENKNVRKEMCWLISNITAGTQKQIGTFLKVPKLVEKVVNYAKDAPWDIRKEAIWAVSNACTGGTDSQVIFMVNQDALESMVAALDVGEYKIVVVALEAIHNMLTVSEREDQSYDKLLHEIGGLDKIESLQSHGNDEVYNKTVEIIQQFFSDDGEECELENIKPNISDDAFSFGMMSPPPSKNLFCDMGSNNSLVLGQQNGNEMHCED